MAFNNREGLGLNQVQCKCCMRMLSVIRIGDLGFCDQCDAGKKASDKWPYGRKPETDKYSQAFNAWGGPVGNIGGWTL